MGNLPPACSMRLELASSQKQPRPSPLTSGIVLFQEGKHDMTRTRSLHTHDEGGIF